MRREADSRRETTTSGQDAVRARTGRRRFLRALAAAGTGSGLAGCLSVDDIQNAGRDEVPIVYAFARHEENDPSSLVARSKMVPATWFDALERAIGVHAELVSLELDGLVGSFVVPGSHSSPSASISIQTTAETVRDDVADLSDDVEFDVDVLDEIPKRGSQESTGRPNTVADRDMQGVPGGVFCGNEETRGTLASALYDETTGRRFFATSNHLYGGSGTDHRGEPLYLFNGDERTTVGRIVRGYREEDVVLAEPTNDYAPVAEIDGATPGTVAGQFTKVGLADLMARGERLEKVGAISGQTTGDIKGIDGTTFYIGDVIRNGQLIWGGKSTFTDGDSGSVNFHVDPEDDRHVLIGGINNARSWWPGFEFTWGTAAHYIRETLGYTF